MDAAAANTHPLAERYYLASSRELSRVSATARAPIMTNFTECMAGASVIRAFQRQDQFANGSMALVDTANRPILYGLAATEWFVLRLESLSTIVFSFSALLLVLLPANVISPALVGLSLTYGLTQNQALGFWAWLVAAAENKIIAVERICQYSHLESEAPAKVPGKAPPAAWPTQGKVAFVDVQLRYRSDTPLVLKGVTCTVEGGHKVGVVGRTGSGKSTLIQALFRTVELAGGYIAIDGLNIKELGLHDLRSKMSIIPQEPTIFEGTVRSNLDPLEQYAESLLWEVLDRCQLGDVVRSKEEKLMAPVNDGGENWSVGQRQLFCLGRALLKRSKILVLDEATASVDSQTDGLIQKTLKQSFAECTVISVAHRIPSVIDSDRVLVMDAGKVAEYDSPRKLLEDRQSRFTKLVAEYSKRSGSMADLTLSQSKQNLVEMVQKDVDAHA